MSEENKSTANGTAAVKDLFERVDLVCDFRFSAIIYILLSVLCAGSLIWQAKQAVIGYLGHENTAQTLWIYHSWEQYYYQTFHFFITNYGLTGSLAKLPELYNHLVSFGERSSVANGLDFIWTWPLVKLFGFPLYYNVKCILIVVINALAMRWLCGKMGCRPNSAFLGGLLFAFNPWQWFLLSTGRIIEAQTFWPVFFIGSFLSAWGQSDPMKWARCGALLALTACNYWFYGHFAVIFVLFFVLYRATAAVLRCIREKKLPSFGLKFSLDIWSSLLLFCLTFSVIILPAAHPYLTRLFSHDNIPGLVRPDPGRVPDVSTLYRQSIAYSCEAFYAFVQPTKGLSTPINPPQSISTEATFSANISLMVMLSFLLLGTQVTLKNRSRLKFWCWAAAAFYLLPLGPFLKHKAQLVYWQGHSIPLPYKFFCDHMPLLDKLFWPCQAILLFAIAAAICIAMSLEALRDNKKFSPQLLAVITIAAVILPFSEALQRKQLPWPSTKLAPAIYEHTQQKQNLSESVIFVPLGRRPWQATSDYNHNFYYDPDLTLVDLRLVIDNNRGLFSRHLYNSGKDVWLFDKQALVDQSFLGFISDLGSQYVPRRFSHNDLEAVQHEGYNLIGVSERLCNHRPRSGAYTVAPDQGQAVFKDICQRLEVIFGPPVKIVEEISYEKDLIPGEITPKSYQIKIYDTRHFKAKAQK